MTDAQDITDPGTPISDETATGTNLEEQIEAKRERKSKQQQLLDLFGDDEEALLFLMGTFDNCTAEEIREMGQLSPTAYATIRKRIQRKIMRFKQRDVDDDKQGTRGRRTSE